MIVLNLRKAFLVNLKDHFPKTRIFPNLDEYTAVVETYQS